CAHGNDRRTVVPQPRPVEEHQFHRRYGADVCRRADHDRDARTVVDDAAKPDGLSGDDDRLVTMPRGLGAMAAMFVVAPLIIRVDNRLIIGFGFLLTALSMWQMSQFSLQMGMAPVIISGLLQGFGLGCTQVPLNILALSTLPRHILTQGTAIRN